MPNSEMPVLQQESWLSMRLYQVGSAIYALGEHKTRPVQSFFLTVKDGRVFENLTLSAEVSPETKPFMVLDEFKLKPRLTDVENNIVQNLAQSQPALRGYDGWQIVTAHNLWFGSADHPDESLLYQYIPEKTADNVFEFMQSQIGNLKRSIGELEKYASDLIREKNRLTVELDEVNRVLRTYEQATLANNPERN